MFTRWQGVQVCLVRCTALLTVAVASARQGRCALLTWRLPTADAVRMLERAPAGQLYHRLTCMPTQATRSQIDGKVNFAIRLLREAAELLQAFADDVHAGPALQSSRNRAR
jgi:hypothetical protein